MIVTFMIASLVKKGINDFVDGLVAWAAGVVCARSSIKRQREGWK
jgi:hypothetical protein